MEIEVALSNCMAWKSRRVLLHRSASKTAEAEIVNVAPSCFDRHDVDLALRLTDGSVTVVAVSDKGRSWDFAD